MSSGASDRNLLVGMLAFQNGFVHREQLLSAMNAWLVEKQTPLEDLFLRQGALNSDQQQLLVALVRQHLAMHDNISERSLAAVSSLGSVREVLCSLADPDLSASLMHVTVDVAVRGPPHPAQQIPPTVGAPTSHGGRFRILRPHARGGLGVVHVALDTELNREVALKEIQSRHADQVHNRTRFTLEAEITGGLEHPGIVPVYGLGTYDDGRPYYAMRFIRGDSLAERINSFHRTDWSASEGQRMLELRKLLARFIDVCDAVQYAHDRGVLHRDLKPGNIMLGKYGETLVVDWGLAKPLGSRCEPGPASDIDAATLPHEPPLVPASGSTSAPTEMGVVVGTPAYMSPEQADGRLDQLGAATDVYGLGATLYALLTCRAPFDAREAEARVDLLHRVAQGEFHPPRHYSLLIPKPLEAICLKAMARQPPDRYATPGQLRDDLEHWLADEPVSAATETIVERAGRFVRKHKAWALASTAALLFVAIVSFAAAVLINEQREQNAQLAADNLQLAESQIAARADAQAEAKRADEQSALALNTLNAIVNNIQGELDEIPAARPVRQKLLSYALSGLEAVAGAADTAREASRSQFRTHLELGEMFTLLGSPRAADEFQSAHEIALRLAQADPDSTQAQRDLSVSYNKLGDVERKLGEMFQAKEYFEEGLAISRVLADADPTSAEARRDLWVSYHKLGDVSREAGADAEANKHYEQSLRIIQQMADADAVSVVVQRDLWLTYNKLGDVQRALGNFTVAKEYLDQGLAISRQLAEADPANAQVQRDLAVSFNRLGDVNRAMDEDAAARKHFEQSLTISRRLAEADPANAGAQRDLWVAHTKLGDLNRALANIPVAKEHYEQGFAISRRLADADPSNTRAQVDVAYSHKGLATAEMATVNYRSAQEHLMSSIAILEKLQAAGRLERPVWMALLQEQHEQLAECKRQLAASETGP